MYIYQIQMNRSATHISFVGLQWTQHDLRFHHISETRLAINT